MCVCLCIYIIYIMLNKKESFNPFCMLPRVFDSHSFVIKHNKKLYGVLRCEREEIIEAFSSPCE